MGNFQARINPSDMQAATPQQVFLDEAVESIKRVVGGLTASLPSDLSASGYQKLRDVVKLDDGTVKEEGRKGLISAAATSEAGTLNTQAQADLALTVDIGRAASLGLDPKRVTDTLNNMLKDELKTTIEEKFTNSHQELVRLRNNFRTSLRTEVTKVANEIADQTALDLDKNDRQELRKLLKTQTINLLPNRRDELRQNAVGDKTQSALPAAMRELDKRVSLATATDLGLDHAKEREHVETTLKNNMKFTIGKKITESYNELCEESRQHAEAKSALWGWAKLLAPAAIGVATWATIAVIGGTSAIFWAPVGVVVAATSFAICLWRQKATQHNHLV